MPQVIATNVMSLNSQRALNMSQKSMATSLERLSSGFRINKAADDAAGLAVSQTMTLQIRGLSQAVRNANDGISMVQSAEGSLAELQNILQRMNELAIQAANGTYSSSDKQKLNSEYTALRDEIDRQATAARYNGITLSGTKTIIQIGDQAGDQISFSIANLGSLKTGITASVTGTSAITTISAALETISAIRADLGATQNTLESTVRNLESRVENTAAARSRIQDADFAQETANLTRTQILQQAGTAMLAQANQLPQNVLSLLG